jgi:MinD-like ATPase involved in chromosome partitioning or flagellar assembly
VSEDDEPPEDDDVSRTAQRQRRAQGAAADLARMGIDPRSLGLSDSPEPPRARDAAADGASDPADEAGASVVQLRPGADGPGPTPLTPAPAQVAEAPPSRQTTRLEELLARTRPVVAPPRSTARLLRSVGKGLVTVDAAVSAQGERDLVETVRQRQSERRVVAFLSGKGGAGCTTVAVAVGTAFMAMREDHSVVVDVQSGTASLGELYGATSPASVASLLQHTEATTPPRNGSGLGLVDGAGWDETVTRGDVAGLLERLGEGHAFHLLDVGNDPGEGSRAALARADQVVLVTGPGRSGAASVGAALDRLRYVNPAAADSTLQVVVCPHEETYHDALREVAGAGTPLAVVLLPPDDDLARGAPYDPERVSPETRLAMLRVAAAVAAGARTR